MFLDVSQTHDRTDLIEKIADMGFFRSPNLRSSDVWHLPAAEEDATHQNHAIMVQEVDASD
jgi:hypothetical protein